MVDPQKSSLPGKEEGNQDEWLDSHRQLMNIRSLTFFNNRDFLQRSFQIELYEICKLRDTVVCLPSGYAKQFFTVMLVKWYQHRHKSILFVGKNVQSINMYAGLLRSHTHLNVQEAYHSSTPLSQPATNPFAKFATAEICLVDQATCLELMQFMSCHPDSPVLPPVNLVIFDQVHQVVCSDQHVEPYFVIAQHFREHFQSRILGLSASIIMEGVRSEVFSTIVREIERHMGCICVTYADLKVINKYNLNARIQLRHYRPVTVQSRFAHLKRSLHSSSYSRFQYCQLQSSNEPSSSSWQASCQPSCETPSTDAPASSSSQPSCGGSCQPCCQTASSCQPLESFELSMQNVEHLYSSLRSICEVFVETILTPLPTKEDESLKLVSLEMLAEMVTSFLDVYTHLGEWCSLKLIHSYMRELDDIALFLSDAKSEYVCRINYAMHTLLNLRAKVLLSLPKSLRKRLLESLYQSRQSPANGQKGEKSSGKCGPKSPLTFGELMALSSERLHTLAKSFGEYLSEMSYDRSVVITYSFPENICAIVYANSSVRVRSIVAWISELASIMSVEHPCNLFSHLKPDYICFKPDYEEKDAGGDKRKVCRKSNNIYYYNQHQKSMHEIHYYRRQEEALKKFRFGNGCNVLCTTSMQIDSIDVFRCSFVFCFDAPETFQNFIHDKGRMRLENGRFVIAAPEDSGYENSLKEFLQIEKLFTKHMPVSHSVEVIPPLFPSSTDSTSAETSDYSISSLLALCQQPVIAKKPAECSTSGCSNIALSLDNALSILNRYCTKIPCDIFTRLSPNYQLENFECDGRILHRCSLQLPINSVFRDKVIGDPAENNILAKRSAAFKAVQILLQIGELDANFYPYRKETTEYIQKLGLEECFNTIFMAPGRRGRGRGHRGRQTRIPARTQASKNRNIHRKCINSAFFGPCFTPLDNGEGGDDCIQENVDSRSHNIEHAVQEVDHNNQYIPRDGDNGIEDKAQGANHNMKANSKDVEDNIQDHVEDKQDKKLYRIGYLYEFPMKLSCHLPDAENLSQKIGRGRAPIDPADSPRNIAVLSPKPFPPLCNFTVYNRSGEITVSVRQIEMPDLVTGEQVKKLRTFHYYIFENALRFGTKFAFIQDWEHGACGDICVVPVLHSKIDWQFVDKIENYSRNGFSQSPSFFDSHGKFVFHQDAYEDAIVIPKYRKERRFFYVAQICHELSPQSVFPDGDYQTFENYYRTKYFLNLTNPFQPLLDVDHTSSRLNLLIPRYLNRKGFKASHVLKYVVEKSPHQHQQRQLLLPELCLIHPIPASFWRKMEAFPSILYRMNSLLNAEQFRSMVATEAGIGVVSLPQGKRWPDLDFGWPMIIQRAIQETQKEQEATAANGNCEASNHMSTKNSRNTNLNSNSNVNPNLNSKHSNGSRLNKSTSPLPNRLTDENDAFSQMDDWTSFEKTIPAGELNSSPQFDLPLEILDFSEMFVPPLDPQSCHLSPNDCAQKVDDFCLNLTSLSNDISKMNFDKEVIEHLNQYYCQDEDFDPDEDDEDELSSELEEFSDAEYISDREDSDDDDDDDIDLDEFGNHHHKSRGKGAKDDHSSLLDSWQSGVNSHRIRSFIYDYLKLEILYDWKHYEKQLAKQAGVELNSDSPFLLAQLCLSDDSSTVNVFETFQATEKVDVERIIEKICNDLGQKNGVSCKFEPLPRAQQSPNHLNLLQNVLKVTIPVTSDSIDHFDIHDPTSVLSVTQQLSNGSNPPEVVVENMNNSMGKEIKFGELLPNRSCTVESVPKLFNFDCSSGDCLGPDPSMILQAVTMSNSADGINLERLETVGDSFLKYSITVFMFIMCPDLNEGRLSFLRSRQISNVNLHRLGQKINLANLMITSKFDPGDNWCPPGYRIDESKLNLPSDHEQNTNKEIFNIFLEHSIRSKSIADCVEALIGTYLISSGTKAAIEFMNWLGLKVRPSGKDVGEIVNDWLPMAPSALVCNNKQITESNLERAKQRLDEIYTHWRLDEFEKIINYKFKDRSFLVQAFTHNSYYENSITDCYQRLEFLGDAVLDYLITRYLYEDPKCHSPGALTDLRSALVNNTFFASLAVKYNFHKYLLSLSPELFRVIYGFVCKFEMTTKHKSHDDQNSFFGYWELFVSENETGHLEDIEVPKALGDIFESVAGAIFLDSKMSLEAVWNAYYPMMKPEIDYFSFNVPKSPIRVLLEMHPHVAKFGKPEFTSGRKIRISVSVNGLGECVAEGRNKRVAKCTAAKRALRALKLVKEYRDKNQQSE